MKKYIPIIVIASGLFGWSFHRGKISAADSTIFQTHEYVTIRWDGRDNTHLVRANGKVEFLGPILKAVTRPERADERAFYLTVAVNAVAKEGYEFAGMTNDEIVMRRNVPR